MAIGTLRGDLLSLPGVERAELDGDPIAPAGIRVRLSQGADASAVACEVRRVLAHHGLQPEASVTSEAPPPPVGGDEPAIESPFADEADGPSVVVIARGGLISVGVAEGSDGVVVTATGHAGDVSVAAASLSTSAIEQAIVLAVAELAGTATRPLVSSVDVRNLDGTSVLTVMIEASGERLVGSAIVRSGRAYAVGRAAWAALSSR